jgi:predicted glycosyltransferase
MRVMLVVTHLLGAGHLTRAAAIARAFARAGHDTTLVSGGVPARLVTVEGLRFVQLPPVRARDADFRILFDGEERPIDEAYLAARADALLRAFHEARPDVLIVELFPFGRRALAAEFLRLLEAAHARMPRPVVASSVRDVLVAPQKPGRVEAAHARFSRWFDFALVHGDPDLIPIAASWPVEKAMRCKLRYTGYVDEGSAPEPSPERSGIVVSGGSSAAGLALYRAALGAAERVRDRQWQILVGSGLPDLEFDALRSAASGHVAVERARPDFRELLARAELSVSQCGYNTAVDVLRTRVPTVFVPFEAGSETEQRLRAEALAARGFGQVVPEAGLSPERLAAAVQIALGQPARTPAVDLGGAAKTVAIVEEAARPAARKPPATLLDEALKAAGDRDLRPTFWWRDDDAVAATSALDRLLRLATEHGIPVNLATIPGQVHASLAERLTGEPNVTILVHGLDHVNGAPPEAKKGEFTHGPLDQLIERAGRALELAAPLGARVLPVFVPPWNRIAPELVPYLPRLGYRGLSTFSDRGEREAAPGLVQVNTHVDPIAWRAGGGALDEATVFYQFARAIEARLAGTADPHEPIGLLTHHLVHDEAVWRVVESLLDRLSRTAKLSYVSAGEAFSLADEPARHGTVIS